MTKTEAQDIITKAIAAEGPIAGTLSIDAFAQRIATALEALGILAYAATPEQRAGNQIIDPASGAKAPAAIARPVSGAARALTGDLLGDGESHSPYVGATAQDVEAWASQRQRT